MKLQSIFLLLCIFFITDSSAQFYTDGPVEIAFRLKQFTTNYTVASDSTQLGPSFAPDEYRMKFWVKDTADLDGQGWVGGQCAQAEMSPQDTSDVLNMEFFHHFYLDDTISPRYFALTIEGWEDDVPSDFPTQDCEMGTSCDYDCCSICCGILLFGTCVGVHEEDDRYCLAYRLTNTFDYRSYGPPGQWNSTGFLSINCGQYIPELEVFWDYIPTCDSISAVGHNKITNNKVRLLWARQGNEVGFNLRGKRLGSSSWITVPIDNGLAQGRTISNLTGKKYYIWQIQGICDSTGTIQTPWSKLDMFYTGCEPIDTQFVFPLNPTSARLQWDDTDDAVAYEILIQKQHSPPADTFIIGGANSFLDRHNLEENTTYFWKVRSWCDLIGTNTSFWTNHFEFTTPASFNRGGCATPTNHWESHISPTSARLRWDSVPGAYSYKIRGGRDGTSQVVELNHGPNQPILLKE